MTTSRMGFAALLIAVSASASVAQPAMTRDDLSPKDLARVRAVTAPATDFSKPEPFEALPGGAATSRHIVNADAFSHFSANLAFEGEERFKLGNALFRKLWVSSPSSTQASDGLGPLFNARACQSCHLKDGRGHPPEGKADTTSMFFRLARAPSTEDENRLLAEKKALLLPDPVYGGQLQDFAVPGHKAEGQMAISYTEMPVMLGDGTALSLRKPSYSVANLGYGPMDPSTVLSPRVTPPMIGLGLVEQIHPADILANADPDDADKDGISGKANMVRFNYFEKMGAFQRDPKTGTYHVDFDKMKLATDKLSEKILTLQGDGDYEGARKMVTELGTISPQLQKDLDRLQAIPVDIIFEQGAEALGL